MFFCAKKITFSCIFIILSFVVQLAHSDVQDYEVISIIGMGGTSSVYLVQHKDSTNLFAMKVIKKSFVHQNNLYAQIQTERDILSSNRSPYTMRLHESFLDKDHLYFVTPFARGGDLMSLMIKYDTFPQNVIRFYLAEILLGLEDLHQRGITLRDLKFENVLIDEYGHLIITDFGLAGSSEVYEDSFFNELIEEERIRAQIAQRRLSGTLSPLDRGHNQNSIKPQRPGLGAHKRSQTTVATLSKPLPKKIIHKRRFRSKIGTLSYISTDILRGTYTQACDLWSLGIILFESLYGHPYFDGETDQQTYDNIIKYKGTLEFPEYDGIEVDDVTKDLMRRLVCFEENASTIASIKNHPFFEGVDWDHLREKRPPFVPNLQNPYDLKYFPLEELEEADAALNVRKSEQEYTSTKRMPDMDAAFKNFPYKKFY